jgi:Ser/Thr protein kinase RdoA (MazF antagonist)
MLASFPASMLNQKPSDLGTLDRFKLYPSRSRSDADLAWETKLLQHLDRKGLTVPVPIPTTDGRLFGDGLVVMTYVEGGPPETEADWRRVA